jgi:glycerol uptake facilitator-like aquaporin
MTSIMWRRYLAEFIGTFAYVFFGCGTRIMVGGGQDAASTVLLRLMKENICKHSSPTSFVVAASLVGASRRPAPFWSYPASTAQLTSSSEPVPLTT